MGFNESERIKREGRRTKKQSWNENRKVFSFHIFHTRQSYLAFLWFQFFPLFFLVVVVFLATGEPTWFVLAEGHWLWAWSCVIIIFNKSLVWNFCDCLIAFATREKKIKKERERSRVTIVNEARGLKIKNSFRTNYGSVWAGARTKKDWPNVEVIVSFFLFLHKSRMHDGHNVAEHSVIINHSQEAARGRASVRKGLSTGEQMDESEKCLCVLIYGIYCIFGHINIFMERFLFDRLFRDYSSVAFRSIPFHHNIIISS